MNKIIGMIEPFQQKQQLYIYKDNMKVDAVETTMDTLVEDISGLIKQYEVTEVDLKGPEKFSKKFGDEIKESMLLHYSNSPVEIKYI